MPEKFITRPHPALYEINTLPWLAELSLKLGKKVRLGNVPPSEWDALKALGMDYIWLMGVWSRSPAGRLISLNDPAFHRLFDAVLPGWTPEDVIGSAYSVSAFEPSPLVGTWQDVDNIRRELHRRGMGLVLDFIPNHTGTDHSWLTGHPEYFIQGSREDYLRDPAAFFPLELGEETFYIAHGRDPNFPPWTDTAQINYFNPEARQAVIDTLEKIAGHCDGVRCDMAMLVLNGIFRRTWGWTQENVASAGPAEEFWTEALQKVPGLVYIAEAYWDTEWTLQQLGFDFVYDKKLYDRLKNAPPHEVYLHLTAGPDYQAGLLRFLENHDEPGSLEAFGREKARAAAALTSALPGLRLYFHGQWEGRQVHLPMQLRRAPPEPVDADILAFYSRLLPLVDQPVFHDGSWQLKPVFPEPDNTSLNLVACTWKLEDVMMLVIVNLAPQPAAGRVCFQDEIDEQRDYTFTDKLNPGRFTQNGKILAHPGLAFELDAYQARIYEILPETRIS
jgi:hypothetical protein